MERTPLRPALELIESDALTADRVQKELVILQIGLQVQNQKKGYIYIRRTGCRRSSSSSRSARRRSSKNLAAAAAAAEAEAEAAAI